MLKHFAVILATLAVSVIVRAQVTGDIQTPKLVPPSPDAAALGKYGEIPVDKSTGVPSISIPLYEIKTPRFSLPISLSYHASGIKVEEISSWVGAGWALNAGGVITRSIVGLPDDGSLGYLTNHGSIKHASAISWPADIQYISKVLTNQLDIQPDNFYYNFNGHSGAFVFGDDAKPMLIPYAPIKIGFDLTSDNFSVTDEEGNTYSFATKEYVTSSLTNMSGTSSWYITQMVSADQSDTIKFNYSTDAAATTEVSYNFSQQLSTCGTGNTYTLQPYVVTSSSRQFNCVRINSIQFKGGKVDFVAKSGRLDEGVMSLDSVIVSNYNSATGQYGRLKSFKLLTDYFYSTYALPVNFVSVGEPDKHRLKLTGLVENDGNNTPTKTHQFDYNNEMLPQVHSYAQDEWGYFNGQIANQTLLDSQLIVVQEFYGGLPSYVDTIAKAQGANRKVSPTDMQAGVLTKITYPTKGYTTFNYECNKQEGIEVTPHTTIASGIGLHTETDIEDYTPTNDMLASGGTIFHIKLRRGNDNPGYPLPYVEVYQVSNESVIFTLTASATNNIDSSIYIPLPNSGTPIHYQLIAVATGGSSPTSPTLPYAIISSTYQAPSGSNLINTGGLRIQSINNYNFDGTLLGMETYTYGNNDQSGGGIQLSFSMIHQFSHQTACDVAGGGTLGSATTYSNTSYYPLAFLNGSPIGYPTVTVYNGDTIHNAGKTIYAYNIFPDSLLVCTAMFWNGIKPISVSWKNGEPVSESYYRNKGSGQYSLVRSASTSYNFIWRKGATGTVINYNPEIVGNYNGCGVFVSPYVDPGTGQVYTCAGSPWLPSYFYWFDYPISTGVRIPASSSVSEYDSSGTLALITGTTCYYDDTTLYLPTRTVTTDSKGQSHTLYTYRPLDKAAINALTPLSSTAATAIDSMVARNIITPVIQQAEYKNSNLTQLSLTNYNNWTSHLIAPQTVQLQLAPNAIETRLQFNNYDNGGNIREVQKTSDVKEVYLWGYQGQYPVAKILNTTYAIASSYVTQSVLDNPSDDATLRSQLNNLRSIPNALVTTYTYKPLVGVTSETDPQGKTIYYEYDGMQRLKDIKDKDGNIVKTFEYHYKSQ